MQFNVKKYRKHLIIGGLVIATATPAFALFGLGDIVFDPTNYAQLISQATTAYNQLRTIQSNIQHFSFKAAWQTQLTAMEHVNVRNQFGETTGMTTALNTNSPGTSATAWNMSSVPVTGSTTSYLASQPAGSAQLAQLAMIEASDSISPDCMTAIGQYRAARAANDQANADLAQQQLDTGGGTNSEVEQLNLLNASQAQRMSEMQAQGVLQTCQASQLTVANMQQRNAAADDLNTWSFVQQQQQANPTYIGGGSASDSFIP
jgi:hypothetical protein